MAKHKAMAGSFAWLMAEKVLSLGGMAAIGIAIARHLGPTGFGLQNVVISIASLAAAVTSLGLTGLVTRDLVFRPNEEGVVLGTVSVLSTIVAVIATVVTAIWAFYSTSLYPELRWLTVLVVGAGILRRFEFLESWFILHEKVRSFALARIIVLFVFLAVRVVLLILRAPLEAFVITYAVEAAAAGIRSLVAYRIASGGQVKWTFDTASAVSNLKRSWPVFFSGIAQIIYLRLDVMMLTWWSSASQAGIYSAAARISELWYFIPTILMNAIFPPLLQLKNENEGAYKARQQDILDILAAMGSTVALAVTLTAWWFIPLLYGQDYAAAAGILMVHVWAGIFVFMRTFLSKWMIAEELYMFSLVTHGAGAVINVAVNVILIPSMGAMGAAIATLISYATAGFLSLALHRKTRSVFFMMAKSLVWPLRWRRIWAFAAKAIPLDRLRRRANVSSK